MIGRGVTPYHRLLHKSLGLTKQLKRKLMQLQRSADTVYCRKTGQDGTWRDILSLLAAEVFELDKAAEA